MDVPGLLALSVEKTYRLNVEVSMDSIDLGDMVTFEGTFRVRASGLVADPTTVVLKIKDPAGVTTTYTYGTDTELVRSSEGVYTMDFSPLSSGAYYYRMYGTGAVKESQEGHFMVNGNIIS